MNSRLQHEYSCALGALRPSFIPGDADGQSSGFATASDTARSKNKPLWLKIHPLTLSLLGLALAVVLWGLEYKLSLYHPHPKHSARVSVAKLWLGPRKAEFARSSRIKWHAPPTPELQLLITRYINAGDWNHCACCWEAAPIPCAGLVSRQAPPAPLRRFRQQTDVVVSVTRCGWQQRFSCKQTLLLRRYVRGMSYGLDIASTRNRLYGGFLRRPEHRDRMETAANPRGCTANTVTE
jgi:hypothetical protein